MLALQARCGVTLPLPRPSRADRLVEKASRKAARRSSPVRNAAGAALPKPEVWHCAPYRAWATKRYDCGIKGRPGHACGPRVDGKVLNVFAHPEPEGKGIKASDNRGVVLCDIAHREQHILGWLTFQSKYDFDRDATARRIFESSPWAGKVEAVW